MLLAPSLYSQLIIIKLQAMCKQIVKDKIYECDGECGASGTVWGSSPYTGDSNIYVAAKHAGLVPGKFTKTNLGPQTSFQGTTQNGVSTTPYGNFGSSYILAPFVNDTKPEINEMFEEFEKDFTIQLAQLEIEFNEENEEEYEMMTCTICSENPREYLVFPCCHVHFCGGCIKKVLASNKCSVCQHGVTGHMRVYL